jgi:hypothetical protein
MGCQVLFTQLLRWVVVAVVRFTRILIRAVAAAVRAVAAAGRIILHNREALENLVRGSQEAVVVPPSIILVAVVVLVESEVVLSVRALLEMVVLVWRLR